jgi:hypothetical protein
VAQACNPNYSEGRDLEDFGLTSAGGEKFGLREPMLKKPITRKGLVEWLKVKAPSSSPSTKKKKKLVIFAGEAEMGRIVV